MKVIIAAKKLNISQAFNEYAEQKLGAKLDRFSPKKPRLRLRWRSAAT